jgi:hypothetical protein
MQFNLVCNAYCVPQKQYDSSWSEAQCYDSGGVHLSVFTGFGDISARI